MYDARKSGVSANLDTANLAFGGLVLVVATVAFALVFLLPGSGKKSGGGQLASVQNGNTTALSALYKDKESKAYFTALMRADEDLYRTYEAKIVSASANDRLDLVMESSVDLMMQNASDLAKADVRYFDQIVSETQNSLRAAARSRSKWCKGSTYENFSPGDQRALERQFQRMAQPGSELYAYSMRMNTIIAEAVVSGRTNPQSYGRFSSRDETALQGAMMSLMGEPEIMTLVMAASSGADPQDAIRSVNVCEIAAIGISAIKTVPDQTRGRMWAESMRQLSKFDSLDQLEALANMGALSGF